MTEQRNLYVEVVNGKVVIGSEEGRYVLEPHVALQFANSVFEALNHAGHEVRVQVDRHVTNMQRLQLIARTGHIMRTLKKQKDNVVSTHIVDSILAEIL